MEALLEHYGALVEQCRALLEEELAQYRSGRVELASEFIERKHTLIGELTVALEQLREGGQQFEESPAHLRGELAYVQQKFMQLMKLDREVEKALLSNRGSGAPREENVGATRLRAVARAYKV